MSSAYNTKLGHAGALFRILKFASREQCIDALQARFIGQMAQTRSDKKPTVVLSGGSTPVTLYKKLSNAALEWSNINLTLSDERWVDEGHADSNARLIADTLMRNKAAGAKFVSLKTNHATPEEGLEECERRLSECEWPADFVLLGMGNDGHTASLFPDDPGLTDSISLDSKKRCVAANPASAGQARMSLSLGCLLDSKLICILIFGDDKWQTLQTALQQGSVEQMPVRCILRQHDVSVEVYWAG